ncbi:MAG: hypothetical protein ACYS8W_16295 [Planctomycetota bacterium]|jgi:hypothetical protein
MRYKRTVEIAVFVAIILAAFVPAMLEADPKKTALPLEKLISSDTLFYVSIRDVNALKKELNRCALGRLWKDKSIRKALAPVFEAAGMIFGQMDTALDEADLAVTVKEFAGAAGGQVSFAITEFTAPDKPVFVALADISVGFKQIQSAIRTSLDNLKKNAGKDGITVAESKLKEQPYFKVTGKDGKSQLHIGFHAGCCFVSNQKKAFQDLMSAAGAGGRGNPLVANPAFNAVRNEVLPGGSEIFLLYCDMEKIGALIKTAPGTDEFKAGASAAVSMLGDVKAVGWGTFSRSSLINERFFLLGKPEPPDRKDAGAAGPETHVTFEWANLVPDSAVLYCTTSADPGMVLEKFLEIANRIEPQTGAIMDELCNKATEAAGFDPVKDLVGSLKGEASIFLVPPEQGPIPNFGIVTGIADMDKFWNCFGKLLDYSEKNPVNNRPMIEKHKQGEKGTIYALSSEIETGLPFTPAWAVIGNSLLVTSTPQLIREIAAKPVEETLAGSRFFPSVKAQCLENSSIAVYANLGAITGIIYSSAIPLFRDQLPPGFKLSFLPAPEDVSVYFLSATFSLAERGSGRLAQISSNTCPLAAFLPLLATVMAPVEISIQRAYNETVAINSLRSIYVGQEINKNTKDKYCGSIAELINAGLVEEQLRNGVLAGYSFRMKIGSKDESFELYATPLKSGVSGDHYFYINSESGIIRADFSPDVGPDSPPFYEDE